ncbi:aminodeoxychorismate synthase component I, partial [Rhodovibrio salinarum]
GYLGYELKAECGGADAHAAPDPDAGLLFADRGLAFDHARGEVWVMALEPGEGDDGAAETWMEAVAEALREVAPTPSSGTEAGQSLGPLQLRHDRDAYLRRIRKSLDAIAAGESYEVCLTNMLSASGRMPPLATYRELRRISPAPFAAYLRFGDLAVLSSSPERFLSITSAGQIEAKPIKGTRRRGCDEAEDRRIREELATCEKDRSENLMIVDLLRNDLGVCAEVGSVRVDKIFDVETYATVHQLVSTVAARLRRDVSPVDCVRAAFPGGSMTGAPKIRTMAIIDALEDGPRGIYSGALGYFSLNGAVDLSIVIRTLVMRPDGVQYGVGGAIVALSDPEEEYEEMAVKTSPLSRLTGQAFPGARYRDADGAAPPEHSGAEETQ